jgi:uncharacterized cupredoxin-like copper-binding protein
MTPGLIDRRLLVVAAAVVVVLAGGSTVAIAATNGAFSADRSNQTSSCISPSLAGTVIDVTLVDMNSGDTNGGGMNGRGGMMRGGQSGWRNWRAGMMRVDASPQTAAHGTVSFTVTNNGVINHELVILPLADGQAVGTRAVGADGTVNEASSVAESSANCAAGKGNGIRPGSTGWSTTTLPTGRYELICNIPGHYTAGMYTEFDVT